MAFQAIPMGARVWCWSLLVDLTDLTPLGSVLYICKSVFNLGHHTKPLARLFFLYALIPAWSFSTTDLWPGSGTITFCPHKMHPSCKLCSSFLCWYGRSSSWCSFSGHPSVSHFFTFDRIRSFSVHLAICLHWQGRPQVCPTTELPLLVVVLSKDTLEVVSGSRHQRFFSRLVHGQFYTGKHSVSMPNAAV